MSFCPVPELKYNADDIAAHAPPADSDLWDATYGHESLKIYRFPAASCPAILDVCRQLNNPLDLLDYIEFFKTGGQLTLPAHIDNGRRVALNIPIQGDFLQTGLDLYQAPTDGVAVNGAKGFQGKAVHIATVSCSVPYLVDVSVPHGTNNPTNHDRIIISLTFKQKYSFLDIYSKYISGQLLKMDK